MFYTVTKRIMDIILSTILIIVFFPVMILTAIIISITSPGPVLVEKTNSHIAFNVHSLADAYNQLIENNVKFAAEFNPSESKNLFCYDPDGFLIELKQK